MALTLVWGTLAGVKEWLATPSSNTASDTEIQNIQSAVNKRINLIIKKHVDPAIISPALIDELADIENEWVAGVFRMRRSSVDEAKDHPFVREAKERLQEFIDTHFKQNFLKTALKTVKSFVRDERGSIARVS